MILEDFIKIDLVDELVVFETDTVYGLGCKISSENGISKIYNIKKRDNRKPLSILCSSIEQVKTIAILNEEALTIAEKYWPGPITLICNKKDTVSDVATCHENTVGVRIPDSVIARSILKKNGPMFVTSLNESNQPAIVNYKDTLRYNEVVDYIVYGNDLDSIASTVYDTINSKTIRHGNIVIK